MFVGALLDFILHIDVHLATLIEAYPHLIYAFLFSIIFLETGLVLAPFLPGDSLIFAAGSFAALGSLQIAVLWIVLVVAAIAGDSLNYFIGSFVGPRAFRSDSHFIFNRRHLTRTQSFYERHGPTTVVFARFIPIVRTFAPFVAGIGHMRYALFFVYNVLGAILWVSLFAGGGYFFGRLPIVRDNFSLVILLVIAASIIPLIIPGIIRLFRGSERPPHLSRHLLN